MTESINSPSTNPMAGDVNNGPVELPEFVQECLKIFKEKLDEIATNTMAITGLETSLGQIGCTYGPDGEINGTVLVCKVSDTTTDPVTDTIKVWWFGTGGEIVEDYDGEWESCTSLKALEDQLIEQCKKLEKLIELLTCAPMEDKGVLTDWADLAA